MVHGVRDAEGEKENSRADRHHILIKKERSEQAHDAHVRGSDERFPGKASE